LLKKKKRVFIQLKNKTSRLQIQMEEGIPSKKAHCLREDTLNAKTMRKSTLPTAFSGGEEGKEGRKVGTRGGPLFLRVGGLRGLSGRERTSPPRVVSIGFLISINKKGEVFPLSHKGENLTAREGFLCSNECEPRTHAEIAIREDVFFSSGEGGARPFQPRRESRD